MHQKLKWYTKAQEHKDKYMLQVCRVCSLKSWGVMWGEYSNHDILSWDVELNFGFWEIVMLLKGYTWLVFFSKRKFQTKRIKRHVNGLGKQVKTHFSQLVYEDEGTWYTENLKQLSFSLIWSLLRQGSYRVKRRKLGKGEKEKKNIAKEIKNTLW